MKELKSGLLVRAEEYYRLLDWKDLNQEKFESFIKSYNIHTFSINELSLDNYNKLLKFAKIKS